jgi:hypothetical protein
VREVAESWTHSEPTKFFFRNNSHPVGELVPALLNLLGLDDFPTSPTLSLFMGELQYVMPAATPFTPTSVLDFLTLALEGSVEEHRKSHPRPPNDAHSEFPYLLDLVADSFAEVLPRHEFLLVSFCVGTGTYWRALLENVAALQARTDTHLPQVISR